MAFYSDNGVLIPALSTAQMREVDRIAVEKFNLGILQMMENAGRNLAQLSSTLLKDVPGSVVVLAGPGGNGGGGICCARHLHNRGTEVSIALSKPEEELGMAASSQLSVLKNSGLRPLGENEVEAEISRSSLVVDALIGYSLSGTPRGKAAELIATCNEAATRVISLDIPSGMDSTSGDTPGVAVRADITLTLALPKTGLAKFRGDLYLGDIGIPQEVYKEIGVEFEQPFDDRYWIPIQNS
jgi:NAD(P)H-hydrate epimerase